MPRKTIKVENLARVEGEGALTVTIRDGKVARLDIYLTKAQALEAAGLSE
mgnify:CR=1 FL=1